MKAKEFSGVKWKHNGINTSNNKNGMSNQVPENANQSIKRINLVHDNSPLRQQQSLH